MLLVVVRTLAVALGRTRTFALFFFVVSHGGIFVFCTLGGSGSPCSFLTDCGFGFGCAATRHVSFVSVSDVAGSRASHDSGAGPTFAFYIGDVCG